jgi:AcrR family transcriptional regulator
MSTISKIDKRRLIINAATKLFGQTHDINKVSLEFIAKEAGVSPTTIYNYFETRENLISEVAKNLVQDMLEKSRSIINSDLPFAQKLSELLSLKIDFAGSNSAILNKLLAQDSTIFNQEIKLSELGNLSSEFIKSGKKQGYVNPSISEQTLIEYFDILRTGIASKPEMAFRFEKTSPFFEEFTQLLYYGFLNKDVKTAATDVCLTHREKDL